MVVEQVIDIPADRRISLDLPREAPTGKARIEVKVIPFVKKEEKPEPPLKCLVGVDTSRVDRLLGILSHAGDISPEEIRAERLAKYK